jgi:peptidoglycan/xylan/chitin deacetylase (PgdA/CDA1 family)
MLKINIYLTIDDCPSVDFNSKIEFLIEKNIPAILFFVGDKLRKRPVDIQYLQKHNFVIGNHSYSHPHFSQLDMSACRKEIVKAEKLIYESYKISQDLKLFRFPYGDKGISKVIRN